MEARKQGEVAFISGRWPLNPDASTLVFIHGAGESSLLWRSQVPELLSRANTLAVDLPGHGRSGGSGRSRVEDYAGIILDFIDAVPVPNPVPCGLSMGGAIVQQLLLDYPDRFRGGIVVSSGARLRVMPQLFETIAENFPGYVALIDQWGFSEKTPSAIKQPFLEDSLNARPEIASGDFKACDRFDVTQRLAAIRVPVLVVSAADDRLTPPKYAEFLASHIPRSSRAHISEAGHFAPIERPREVNAAIIRFLDDNNL